MHIHSLSVFLNIHDKRSCIFQTLYANYTNFSPKIYIYIFSPSRLHANLTKGFGIMGPKEFFPLLDFAFMPKNALSSR